MIEAVRGQAGRKDERLLCRLRDLALEAGVADKFFVHDFRRAATPLSKLRAAHEVDEPFESYCAGHDQPLPWVRLEAEDRLAWVEHLPALLAAFQGEPVSVVRNPSWRWDQSCRTASGGPRFVPVYQVLIFLSKSSGYAFDAHASVPHLLASVCAVDHPLADRKLFEWQQEVCGEILFNSYHWTTDGFVATFFEKTNLERAQQELFAGWATETQKEGKGLNATWTVTVRLPAQSRVEAQE